MKRLTAEEFAGMLEGHPEFSLIQNYFCDVEDGKLCGGCAMTLAYIAAGRSPRRVDDDKVMAWADKVFGWEYRRGFVNGFDNVFRLSTSNQTAYDDGVACRLKAIETGRLV